MPIYEYRCEKCSRTFALQMTMAQHDASATRCPECQGEKVVQQYSTFFPKTSRKS